MTKSNNWIDHLRRKMSGYRQPAPPTLLHDIKQEMARRGMRVEEPRAQQTGSASRRWIAAASVAALLASGGAYWWSQNGQQQEQVAQRSQQKKQPATSTQHPQQSAPPQAQQLEQPLLAQATTAMRQPKATGATQHPLPTHKGETAQQVETQQPAQPTAETQPSEQLPEQQPQQTEQPQPALTAQQSLPSATTAEEYAWLSSLKHDGDERPLTAQVYFTGMHNVNQSSGNGDAMLAFSASDPISGQKLDTDLLSEVYGTEYPDIAMSDFHHKQPIKIGAQVAWSLDKHWTVQTGLFYSYLASDVTVNYTRSATEYYNQKLHFVGLPVSMRYNWISTPTIQFYSSLGGEVQKLVSGKMEAKSPNYDADMTGSLSMDRPQWSINGAVGMEYKPTETIGLYAEPGVSHYLDNHSKLQTIYKDKPWAFSLSLGVRFKLGKP